MVVYAFIYLFIYLFSFKIDIFVSGLLMTASAIMNSLPSSYSSHCVIKFSHAGSQLDIV
jgi:hypothetical protein